ncbi:MAG: hypothetical protein QRY71_04100 [Candidatus Rhabdochlamydia sp.]
MLIKPENFTSDFNEELLKILPKRIPLYVRNLMEQLLTINQQSENRYQQLESRYKES